MRKEILKWFLINAIFLIFIGCSDSNSSLKHQRSDVIKVDLDSTNSIMISKDKRYKLRSDVKPDVTILFIYNEAFWEWCNKNQSTVDSKLNSLIDYTNTAFSKSAINATISIAGSEKITFDSDTEDKLKLLEEAQEKMINPDDELFKLREEYKADVVFVLRKTGNQYINRIVTGGGVAHHSIYDRENYLQISPDYAIGMADIETELGEETFAHELGHIFGCHHDAQTRIDYDEGLQEYNKYANGYWFKADNKNLTTIMGYNTDGRIGIQHYSNPNIDYKGVATGIAGDGTDSADCARFINFSAPYISDYRKIGRIGANQPPIADTGEDQSVDEKTKVILNGSATDSDGTVVSYKWTQYQDDKTPSVKIINADTPNAYFMAPNVDKSLDLYFRLTVIDNSGNIYTTDYINVLINNLPEPVADAGENKSVDEKTKVTLNGSATDSDGTVVSYKWSQIEGTSVEIINADTPNAYFIAPVIEKEEILKFKLTVTDDDGQIAEDEIIITLQDLPMADAGDDENVDENITVFLNGEGSYSKEIKSYKWTQVAGIMVDIIDSNSLDASFISPMVDGDMRLKFELSAIAEDGKIGTDKISIIVKNSIIKKEIKVDKSDLDTTLTQLIQQNDNILNQNHTLLNNLLSNYNVMDEYSDDKYNYKYYMVINQNDKLGIFLITKINNPDSSLVKSLNMKENFIILIDANREQKLVWSGYGDYKLDLNEKAFITTWDTTKNGVTESNQIRIRTNPNANKYDYATGKDISLYSYNYKIDWGDGKNDIGITDDITHTYDSEGSYTVKITGVFPAIYFEWGDSDHDKLISIEQWGTGEWKSMNNAFSGCENMVGNFLDTPNLSSVTDMSSMFQGATSFNKDISNWNVSNVSDMSKMFASRSNFSNYITIGGSNYKKTIFNQDISNWDVSNVINMYAMFGGAESFNQDISNWDVSNVINMSYMFNMARVFNQDIGNWDVSNVTDMSSMFESANIFNQDISSWNVFKVNNMEGMFQWATIFNQDLTGWDVSSVTNMDYMFFSANMFNKDISSWNVLNVTSINFMFQWAGSFNQDLSRWNVDNVKYHYGFMKDVGGDNAVEPIWND